MILGGMRGGSDSTGFHSGVTLDAIAASLATAKPDGLALVDPTDRPIFTDGARRRLTWAQLDDEVKKLASRLIGLKLGSDAVIAYQMPNTVEAFIVLLAILRAGYIAAPFPLAWRQRELRDAAAQIGAKAVITVARAGPVIHANLLRYVAADVFAVRFLLSYGRNIPDGVIPLDEDLCPLEADEALLAEAASGQTADHIALITWDAGTEGFVPVARSHSEVIAAALAYLLEAKLESNDVVATSLLSASLAGLATGFISTLLAGAALVLHHPFSSRVFAGTLITESITHAVLPGAAVMAMAEAGRLPSKPLRAIAAIWRSGERSREADLRRLSPKLIDVHAFGETGMVALTRDMPERQRAIPLGKLTSPQGSLTGPSLIATRIGESGFLELSGSMVPTAVFPVAGETPSPPPSADGWIDTGVQAAVDGYGHLHFSGPRAGVAQIGGLALPRSHMAAVLQDALGVQDAERLACGHDALFGERLVSKDLGPVDELRNSLSDAGVTPALSPLHHPLTAKDVEVA